VRTSLLAIMPTLDDVDITPAQRGDQSRGVVILGPGGPGSAAGGHGHGGILVGGGPAGSRGGASAGCRGGTTGGSSAVAPSKGKQMCVAPGGRGGRDEEGCRGEGHGGGHDKGSSCRGGCWQNCERGCRSCRGLTGPRPDALSGRGQDGCSSKWLHPASQTSLHGCLKTSVCPAFSPPFLLFLWGLILLLPFLPGSSSSGTATATGMTTADAAVGVTPGSAPASEPQTPKGVPEDMVESEGEPEVAPKPVLEVV
jgi:hypothetical protein